jgi:hypothetical protein
MSLTLELPPQDKGRAARKHTAMGKYAHIPVSSDEFAREKQDEIAREDRRESGIETPVLRALSQLHSLNRWRSRARHSKNSLEKLAWSVYTQPLPQLL